MGQTGRGGRDRSHHLDLLEAAGSDWEVLPVPEWGALNGYLIDAARAALDRSFGGAGNVRMRVTLTIAAVPLWFVLSLISECGEQLERALAVPGPDRSPSDEMHLLAALASSLMQTRGLWGRRAPPGRRFFHSRRHWATLITDGGFDTADLQRARYLLSVAPEPA